MPVCLLRLFVCAFLCEIKDGREKSRTVKGEKTKSFLQTTSKKMTQWFSDRLHPMEHAASLATAWRTLYLHFTS